ATSATFADAAQITSTWTGAGGTYDWSNPNNWSPVQALQSGVGQLLNFPFGVASAGTIDDIPNLTVGGIQIGGNTTIAGDLPLTLSGKILAAGAPGSSYSIDLPLKILGQDYFFVAAGALIINDPMSGTGNLTFQGTGTTS